MDCTRCQGTMVGEQYINVQNDSMTFHGWRCINCGNRIDDLIQHHRTLQDTRAGAVVVPPDAAA